MGKRLTFALGELVEKARFADTHVTDDDVLEDKLVRERHYRCFSVVASLSLLREKTKAKKGEFKKKAITHSEKERAKKKKEVPTQQNQHNTSEVITKAEKGALECRGGRSVKENTD